MRFYALLRSAFLVGALCGTVLLSTGCSSKPEEDKNQKPAPDYAGANANNGAKLQAPPAPPP